MNFYTYIYHDDIVPIYVGKGKDNRAFVHIKKSHNTHLKNKLAKMKREGREPRIQIIDAPDEAAAFEMEELLISMIGRKEAQNRSDVKAKKSAATKVTLACRAVKAKQRVAAKLREECVELKAKRIMAASKPCTVDGETIYESRKKLVEALGLGKNGFKHPNFRYVEKETSDV